MKTLTAAALLLLTGCYNYEIRECSPQTHTCEAKYYLQARGNECQQLVQSLPNSDHLVCAAVVVGVR